MTQHNTIALLGGLGNQLFQVAFATWLERQTDRPTRYDISYYRKLGPIEVLDVPAIGDRIRHRVLTPTRWWPTLHGRVPPFVGRTIRRMSGPRRVVCDYTEAASSLDSRDTAWWGRPAWWFGNWQRLQYAETLLPELATAIGISSSTDLCEVVGVHVRRGDALTTPLATPAQWFRSALEDLGAEGTGRPIRVWSDDPDWCKAELDLGLPFEVAPDGTPIEHLAALARCTRIAISRSTFSWWAGAIASSFGGRVAFPTPWGYKREAEQAVIPTAWLPVACASP
jgi:hypothetical protein